MKRLHPKGLLPIIILCIISSCGKQIKKDDSPEKISLVESYISEGDLSKARETLYEIKKEDSLYFMVEGYETKLDSLSEIQWQEEKRKENENFRFVLKTAIDEFKSGKIDGRKYRGSIENLQRELIMFSDYAEMVQKGKDNSEEDIQDLAENLSILVSKFQKKEFPILRQNYTKYIDKKLWEFDINVESYSTGENRIRFIGGTFAANRNIKEYQNTVFKALEEFRFKRSEYLWNKYDDDYTYYTIDSPDDGDVRTL